MTRSRAAVFHGHPQPLELCTFPTPQPARGEVLVRVLGCTLCGSDLHTVEGRRAAPVPTVLGHEIVGEIVSCGDASSPHDLAGNVLSLGDRITWSLVARCGECFYCQRGLPQKCAHAVKYGHEAQRPGRELLGGLAEHCLLVPGTAIVRLPEDLPLEVACPASCATATVAAGLETAGRLQDRCVLILGAGMLGLTACAMAKTQGTREVIAVDVDAERREQALAFGATHAAPPDAMKELVQQVTGGYGVDAMLECSGSSTAFEAAWPSVRLGGAIVLIGSVFPSPPVPLPLEQVVRRNLALHGVHNYRPEHLAAAVEFLAAHHEEFPLKDLVSRWFPLDDVRTAIEYARDSRAIRIGVRP